MPQNDISDRPQRDPVFLDECSDLLPRDRTCQSVRLTQFLLPGCFGRPATGKIQGGSYAIIQPQYLGHETDDEIDPAEIKKDVEQRVTELKKRLPVAGALASGRLPNPNARQPNVKAMRRELAARAPELCSVELEDSEVRQRYAAFLQTAVDREMRRVGSALQRAGLADRPVKSEDQLRQVVQRVYYPEPYQPLNAPFPHVAFCARFEQMWCPTGYTRGELITSIALAPGEELTLEMHSWTKENFKSERELAVESEVTLNNRLTARDHLEVISRMATQTSIGSNANASVTIPVKGIPIGVSGGVTSSTALNNALDTTVQRTAESTAETASALRSQRKMRIEVARETGSDERQLRKVANPNRCHTLNVHYYEVISNYDVKVKLTELIPCVLLPVTLDPITEDWVLCHEHILKGGLLSRTFLPGFDAAKTLATQAMLERLEEEAELPAPSATPPAGPADPLEQEMLNHRGAILAAYDELTGIGEAQRNALASLSDALAEGDFVGAAATVGELMDVFPKLLALGLLQMNRTAVSALDGLQAAAGNNVSAIESVRNFFANVTPRDFRNVNPLGTVIGKALEELGIPASITDILVWTTPELLNLVRDDCGLFVAVNAAHQRLRGLNATLSTRDVEQQAGAAFEEAAARGVFSEPEAPFSDLQLAEAKVEFERLRCHIEENHFHYLQLVWTSGSVAETWRRVFPELECLLERQPIGFVDDHAAYPVQFTDPLRRWFSLDGGARVDIREHLERLVAAFNESKDTTTVITLPTLGTFAEATLGQCGACEEYVIDSRAADVRQENAKAALDEARARIDNAEAERREKRIASDPPDLSDPIEHTQGQLHIDVGGTEDTE